ncbi:MAG: hypothetical protein KJ622_13395 [Alphaproteobacteria bacterium]|nr:hypothetical protein [Alphaproteobacteria bacterium]
MPYRTLNSEHLVATVEKLERRIIERFPGCGLAKVCAELSQIARDSSQKVAAASEPNIPLRVGIALVLFLGLALLAYVGTIIDVKRDSENLFGVLEGIDAAVNTLIVTGAGIYFLTTLEGRWHRDLALKDLHELRSIIHVIDMHQLTKDPSRIATVGTLTPSSPQRPMTPFELSRYLDYCSEMLSLAAKIAALYAQGTRDPLIIETAAELGQITSNISSKIWQKITLVHRQISTDPPEGLGISAMSQSPSVVKSGGID